MKKNKGEIERYHLFIQNNPKTPICKTGKIDLIQPKDNEINKTIQKEYKAAQNIRSIQLRRLNCQNRH